MDWYGVAMVIKHLFHLSMFKDLTFIAHNDHIIETTMYVFFFSDVLLYIRFQEL